MQGARPEAGTAFLQIDEIGVCAEGFDRGRSDRRQECGGFAGIGDRREAFHQKEGVGRGADAVEIVMGGPGRMIIGVHEIRSIGEITVS